MFPLKYIQDHLSIQKSQVDPNRWVSGISIDSRTIQRDNVFIAIRGETHDGHRFIRDAIQKGAAAVLIDQIGADTNDIRGLPVIVVEDTLLALQELAKQYRQQFEIPIIAITGSNGKTTTKDMTAAILAQKYHVLKNEGNLNNHFGVPLTLLKLNETHEAAVVEMGMNHFGELTELCRIAQPTIGMIINVGAAHLEFFGTVEQIAVAKGEIIQNLPATGLAVLNADDPLVIKQKEKTHAKIITFAMKNKADFQVTAYDALPTSFQIQINDSSLISIPLAGLHNAYNALAAITIGRLLGVSDDQIQAAFHNFRPSKMRFETIEINGWQIINDAYNANPVSMKAALQTISQYEIKGKRIAILGDMYELGETAPQLHYEIGKVVAQFKFDQLITVGQLAKHIREGAIEAMMPATNVHWVETPIEVVDILLEMVQSEDLVLLKASRGIALEQIINTIQKERT